MDSLSNIVEFSLLICNIDLKEILKTGKQGHPTRKYFKTT